LEFLLQTWYNIFATALIRSIRHGREVGDVHISDLLLSLLVSVVGSVLGALIVQRLGR
jgi:hypothetical protein